MLNAHAAVLEAAFPQRRMGMFRATLDRGQARYVNDPLRMFSGTVPLGLLGLLGSYTTNINIPQNTLTASVQVAWGPQTSINDLSMQLTDPSGNARPVANTLNLPVLTGRRERDVINESGARDVAREANTHSHRHAASLYRHARDHARRIPAARRHQRFDCGSESRCIPESAVVRDGYIRQQLPPAIHNLALRSGFGAGGRRARAAIHGGAAALH